MRVFPIVMVSAAIAVSCSAQRKIESIRNGTYEAALMLPDDSCFPDLAIGTDLPERDTLTVEDEGKELIIMKAVRDENGDMVANDVIDAAIVTARFKNVAERHGKVDLKFLVTVPASMLDTKWQMRLVPEMATETDTVTLDRVIITGKEYRKGQLRGYEQYERFLASIITDSTEFIRRHELDVFLHRNIPALYDLKTDSTFVSDESFSSIYGVSERQAVEHYTNQLAAGWNRRKISNKDRMFSKLVKVPVVTEGLRLDTVITASNGDFIYEYSQTINVSPQLKKVDVSLSGGIFEESRSLYSIPPSDPVTFYISSLSSLCVDKERYLTQVLERRLTANSTYWIDFDQGSAEINPSLSTNSSELARIKDNLGAILENEIFDLDSIIVTASCSPEGTWRTNDGLSIRRSSAVSAYFRKFCQEYSDSLNKESGIWMSMDGRNETGQVKSGKIKFISRNIPENWDMLHSLVKQDTGIPSEEKNDLYESFNIPDPDSREKAISTFSSYPYIRESIYPRLRNVRFDFHLHRKGMVKDTIHTSVLDTAYMAGVQAIRDRNYQKAVTSLRPYHDYNAAVAFCCMDYNESALDILKELKQTPEVLYLLSIVYSRKGLFREAVECYMRACSEDHAFVHRGNLDPEISGLMKMYEINLQ